MHSFTRVTTIAATIGIAVLGAASTSLAADSGSAASMQRAILIANDYGVAGVHQVQFSDGRWQIEGRDPRGREVRMDIDGMSGAVLRVDRDD